MGINHKRDSVVKHYGRNRKVRPKTFASEDAARKYAEANKISSFELVNLKNDASSTKKFRIVSKK